MPVYTFQTSSKPTTGLGSEQMTYGAFFKTIGLENPGGRNITNAQLALARATGLGITGWKYDSVNFKFYLDWVLIPNSQKVDPINKRYHILDPLTLIAYGLAV